MKVLVRVKSGDDPAVPTLEQSVGENKAHMRRDEDHAAAAVECALGLVEAVLMPC